VAPLGRPVLKASLANLVAAHALLDALESQPPINGEYCIPGGKWPPESELKPLSGSQGWG
jgi:hypothetical protein